MTQIGANTLYRSENKRDIVKKKTRGGKGCCCWQNFASENLSHREARYVFPSVEYKSPSPARFEERYKRVGSYYFYPESRSLSNGLSSFLPSLGQRNGANRRGRRRKERRRGDRRPPLCLPPRSVGPERPTLWDPITKRLTLIKD